MRLLSFIKPTMVIRDDFAVWAYGGGIDGNQDKSIMVICRYKM